MIHVRVSPDDFDAGAELAKIGTLGVGGVASFVGHVRGDNGLVNMRLDHYPAMTVKALDSLATLASTRWSLAAVTIIHRVGVLVPGEQIVLVATASKHRADALQSTQFLIDQLKTTAPFWKQEQFADGSTKWVDAKEEDDVAAGLWAAGS